MAQSESEKRSNVESLGMQEGTDTFTGPTHSGHGQLGSSIVQFVICFAVLLFCLYALGTYPEGGAYWFAGAVLLFGVAFFIPFHLLPSKTNNDVKGDVEQNML